MEEYSGEPIAIVDQTQKRRLPYSRSRPAGKRAAYRRLCCKTKRGLPPRREQSL